MGDGRGKSFKNWHRGGFRGLNGRAVGAVRFPTLSIPAGMRKGWAHTGECQQPGGVEKEEGTACARELEAISGRPRPLWMAVGKCC